MYKGTKLLKPLIRCIIYSVIYLLFMPCGTKLSLYFFISGRRGELWSVGSESGSSGGVDAMDTRSIRSEFKHVLINSLK